MRLKQLLSFAILFLSIYLIAGCSGAKAHDSGNEETDFPPSMTGVIHINEMEYKLKAGGYRWERKNGFEVEVVRTDAASPNQIAEELEGIIVEPNSTMTIAIDGDPEIDVYLWSTNGKEKAIPVHNYELSAPSATGQYIYEIVATWSTGEVSYTFVVDVT